MNCKRILSLLLALLLAVSVLPVLPVFAADYDMEICGVAVNDGNKDDILGDGKFAYDPAANVLTVKGETSYDGTVIGANIGGLTIKADGDVKLTSTSTHGYDEVIGLADDTTITGSFTLTAADPSVDALYVKFSSNLTLDKAALNATGCRAVCGTGGKLTVKDSDVTATAAADSYAIYGFDAGIKLVGCAVTAPASFSIVNGAIWDDAESYYAAAVTIERGAPSMSYPIWIADVQVDDANCDDVLGDGIFAYNPYSNRLFIRGDYEFEGDAVIKSDQKDLTIIPEKESVLRCLMTGGCGMFLTNDTTILGGETLICFADTNGYGIFLGGESKTLTIEDASVGGSGWYGGITAMGSGTIVINSAAVSARSLSGSNAALSADRRLEINGCTLETPAGGSWDTNRVYDSLGNVAELVSLVPDVTQYLIMIDGVVVTSANQNNILHDTVSGGRFSYDPASNTLYLGGNYTSENQPVIVSEMPDLTIKLKRSCTLTAKDAPVIVTGANLKLTTDDLSYFLQLNGDTDNACIQVDTTDAVNLEVEGLSLYLTGDYGLCGYDEAERLLCSGAYIMANCNEEAICDFGRGLTLYEDRLVRPCDGQIVDGDILNRDGDITGLVEIRRDSFLPGEMWRAMFVTDHGKTPDPATGHPGDPITKPADPTEAGWKFLGWYTDDTYAEAWDFSKPGGSITLYAKWEPGSAELVNPFEDVIEGRFYYDAVLWAYYATPQITNGMDATHFAPEDTCKRSHIVTFLWRAKGCPEPTMTESPFTDVTNKSAFYYKAVLWAVENGITAGKSPTTFAPDAGCKRSEVVTFLWRAEGKPAPAKTENPFNDVKSGTFYYDAVLWAYHHTPQITNGMDMAKGLFGTDNTCTRGQIATFLKRTVAPD